MEKPSSLVVDGKRLDGRAFDELRPIKMQVGVLENADGSALVEFGKTRVMAAVFGPREVHPRHLALPDRALLRARYDMLSFSVEDRKRPGPGRREVEISKVLTEALSSVVLLERFPKTAIDVFIYVIQADASTRVTGLNAAALALADAGIPMRDLVTSVSFGKIYDEEGNGYMVVDIFKPEDNWGLADVAYAVLPNTKKVVLLQMDGKLSPSDFRQGLKMANEAIEKIHALQVKALKEPYLGGVEE